MSELDLGLKVGTRALLWSMGYSTRLDVELRGARRGRDSRSAPAPEGFTDLDVLGVQLTTGYQLITAIADCKSGQRDRPTARMFWARGVADLFGADQILLVREHDVPDATRQLSSRLNITVLPSSDLVTMQQLHNAPGEDPSGPLGILFDRTAVAAQLAAFQGMDRRLGPLLEYRQFDYWIYEHHRNLTQLLAHLEDAASHLDPRNPVHLALFLDLAWLYLLALIRVTQHIRGAFLADPDRGLQEYLFGGPIALLEKQQAAEALQAVKPAAAPDVGHLPPYYGQLRELVVRLLRRPAEMQTALRYAEASSALVSARRRVTLSDAFGDRFDAIAAKLLADVCGFLVAATQLHSDFRSQARAYLLAEPVMLKRPPHGNPRTAPPESPDQPEPGPASGSDPARGPSPAINPSAARPDGTAEPDQSADGYGQATLNLADPDSDPASAEPPTQS